MKERPILFNGDMVRAILEGRKTQTRRVMKTQPANFDADGDIALMYEEGSETAKTIGEKPFVCPYGEPGDRLWVREAHALLPRTAYRASVGTGTIEQVEHPTDGYTAAVFRERFDRSGAPRWRPSIHMPRWASRITLEIVSVRVEQLQEISEEDALAEGVSGEREAADAGLSWYDRPRRAFRFLWPSINGADSWDDNPWVWVVEFKRVDAARAAA